MNETIVTGKRLGFAVYTPSDARSVFGLSVPEGSPWVEPITTEQVLTLENGVRARFGAFREIVTITFTRHFAMLATGPGRKGRIGIIAEPSPLSAFQPLAAQPECAEFAAWLRLALNKAKEPAAEHYDLTDENYWRLRRLFHAIPVAWMFRPRGNSDPAPQTLAHNLTLQAGAGVRIIDLEDQEADGAVSVASSDQISPRPIPGRQVATLDDFDASMLPTSTAEGRNHTSRVPK
jgi:hypothetical protein